MRAIRLQAELAVLEVVQEATCVTLLMITVAHWLKFTMLPSAEGVILELKEIKQPEGIVY